MKYRVNNQGKLEPLPEDGESYREQAERDRKLDAVVARDWQSFQRGELTPELLYVGQDGKRDSERDEHTGLYL